MGIHPSYRRFCSEVGIVPHSVLDNSHFLFYKQVSRYFTSSWICIIHQLQMCSVAYVCCKCSQLCADNSFDERKFVINNNEKAKDFDWREHGIILHVSEKAFSTTTSECTIDVKSSPTGVYDFPEDAEPVPVSNVYDINTSETLCKPITVVIDHCVAIDPDDDEDLAQLENIRLVVADSSKPQSSYQFRYIESNYTVTPTSVMVSMPHFCFLAAVFSQGHSRTRFCAKIFLQSESLTSHYIHFVLIRNLASYIQVGFAKGYCI